MCLPPVRGGESAEEPTPSPEDGAFPLVSALGATEGSEQHGVLWAWVSLTMCGLGHPSVFS